MVVSLVPKSAGVELKEMATKLPVRSHQNPVLQALYSPSLK